MKRLLNYSFWVIFSSLVITYVFFTRINSIGVRSRDVSAIDYCGKNKDFNNIIFIGASRTRYGINPKIIDSVTQLKTMNLSFKGTCIVESNMLVEKYIQNHPLPQTIFLNTDPDMFSVKVVPFNITEYFSYLEDTLIYRCLSPYNAVYRNKLLQKYYLILKTFSLSDQVKDEVLLSIPTPEMNSYHGYYYNERNWTLKGDQDLEVRTKVDFQQKGFDILEGIIKKCREKSINIVLINPPTYIEWKKRILNLDEVYKKLNPIIDKWKVPYWDYSNMEICKSKEFFAEGVHLNTKGSRIFSEQLALDIKKLYEK